MLYVVIGGTNGIIVTREQLQPMNLDGMHREHLSRIPVLMAIGSVIWLSGVRHDMDENEGQFAHQYTFDLSDIFPEMPRRLDRSGNRA